MHAWNYGRRIAEGGLGPPFPLPLAQELAHNPPRPQELAAIVRLGDDIFHAWATRGWWAAHTSKETP